MIDIQNLSVTLNQQTVLTDVSFKATTPGIIGIMGPNGAGKSTLIKSMLGFIRHTGTATYNGRPMRAMRQHFAYIPQRSTLDLDFPITVEQVVRTGQYGSKEVSDVTALLDDFALIEVKDRALNQLSGGQLQRVLFARSLVAEREVYFLDEPFIGIDYTSMTILNERLQYLKQAGKLIFIVHHDIHSARDLFDEVLLLNRQLKYRGEPAEVLSDRHLTEVFFSPEDTICPS
ncbi:metal ABC transporter ATP-binding protein [Macrococcus carouselicus]|uniref:Metal ABC transporter ATP-binding protein n=1 Tax=Macrococcus carouselicus TaxID=69969 RepID=A0A9Q8CKM3_9STAP|nr:metal ABC transporter ATP-binding protein [Macrococcus carouselicus]TDM04105.1 metal ABC transporter ATP-binding protein [Macrococcus carouselicus]